MKDQMQIKEDPKNYRKHSERNLELIEKSLADCGAGRSIVTDAAGVVIGGNVSLIAKRLGVERVEIADRIEADPDFRRAVEDEREHVADMAEQLLVKAIRDGDTRAAARYLRAMKPKRSDDDTPPGYIYILREIIRKG